MLKCQQACVINFFVNKNIISLLRRTLEFSPYIHKKTTTTQNWVASTQRDTLRRHCFDRPWRCPKQIALLETSQTDPPCGSADSTNLGVLTLYPQKNNNHPKLGGFDVKGYSPSALFRPPLAVPETNSLTRDFTDRPALRLGCFDEPWSSHPISTKKQQPPKIGWLLFLAAE